MVDKITCLIDKANKLTPNGDQKLVGNGLKH